MKRKFLWVLTILTLVFIFSQSLMNQETSAKESTVVQEQIIEPIYEALTGSREISYDIRGAAHIIEFAVLGFELTLLFRDKKRIVSILRSVSCCGMIALLDESIQFLSDRAPEVVDIWSDILGGGIGAVIGMLLIMAIGKCAERRRSK